MKQLENVLFTWFVGANDYLPLTDKVDVRVGQKMFCPYNLYRTLLTCRG